MISREGIEITFSMPGLSKMEDALKTLPEKLAKRHLAASIRKGLKIVQRAEQAGINNKTGNLRESIMIYQRTRKTDPRSTIEFGVKPIRRKWGRKGYHAFLVEYGTKPHQIYSKKGGALKIFGNKWVSHVDHPGAKAHPFINPAIDSNISNVLYAVEDELGNRLMKEIEDFWV